VAITSITPEFAVSHWIGPAELAAAAKAGFRTVINNRPDGEEAGQQPTEEAAAEAARLGLVYRHIPTTMQTVFTDPVVGAMADSLEHDPGPILAYCKSGTRSAIAWAAASAHARPVDEIMAELRAAGLKLAHLRDDLDSQADRKHWQTNASATQGSSSASGRPAP